MPKVSPPKQLSCYPYQRHQALDYAARWSLGRNPHYADFSKIGGDCTNFVSQTLFSGCPVMNYDKNSGWYYVHLNHRAPAWTDVNALYRFITQNKSFGPFGKRCAVHEVWVGDLVQLVIPPRPDFCHSLIITETGKLPSIDSIKVSAHTYDVQNKPLSLYSFSQIRFVQILGFRK